MAQNGGRTDNRPFAVLNEAAFRLQPQHPLPVESGLIPASGSLEPHKGLDVARSHLADHLMRCLHRYRAAPASRNSATLAIQTIDW